MRVALTDGACRACGSALQIIDADDATMTVQCEDCGDSYLVEPDTFGDGAIDYYVRFMVDKQEAGHDVR